MRHDKIRTAGSIAAVSSMGVTDVSNGDTMALQLMEGYERVQVIFLFSCRSLVERTTYLLLISCCSTRFAELVLMQHDRKIININHRLHYCHTIGSTVDTRSPGNIFDNNCDVQQGVELFA